MPASPLADSPFLSPHFYLMGERKCGTSSLYRYLLAHPHVLPCQLKEPQFFSKPEVYVEANLREYFAMFPRKIDGGTVSFLWPELNDAGILYHEEVRTHRVAGRQYWTGEASANTFHEVEPAWLHRFLPWLKLVVIFRDPVARAFSHHRMYQRFQAEGRDLGMKIGNFESDMRQEMATIQTGGQGEFLSPGCYVQNLRSWEQAYGKDQIHVLFAEELAADPQAEMNRLLAYLELPAYEYPITLLQKRFNQAPPAALPDDFAQALRDFFTPYNEALARHLGRNLPW